MPLGRGASGPANASTRPLPLVVETVHEAAATRSLAAAPGDAAPNRVAWARRRRLDSRPPAPRPARSKRLRRGPRPSDERRAHRARRGGAGRSTPRRVVLIAGRARSPSGRGRDGARRARADSGLLLGDEGSGYAIARQGLAAVVRELDGRGPQTAIRERLFATERRPLAGGAAREVYQLRRRRGRRRGVLSGRPRGGEGRRRRGAAHPRRGRPRAGARRRHRRPKLGLEGASFPVATVGGVFAAGDLLLGRSSRASRVAPQARVGPPAYPPEIGAIRLARAAGESAVNESLDLVTRMHEADARPYRSAPRCPRSPARPTRSPRALTREAAGSTPGPARADGSARWTPRSSAHVRDGPVSRRRAPRGRARGLFEAVEGAEDDAGAGAPTWPRRYDAEGRRRGYCRERLDAVRGRGAGRGQGGGRPHRGGRLPPGRGAREARGHSHPPRHRRRSSRRIQPPEGRHRAENRRSTCFRPPSWRNGASSIGDEMVAMKPTNDKLRKRAIRIVRDIAATSEETAEGFLRKANWHLPSALIAAKWGLSTEAAALHLSKQNSNVAAALSKPPEEDRE